jgi:integrase
MQQPRVVTYTNGRAPRLCKWGESVRAKAIDTISTAFAWGVKNKLISANPLTGIEKGTVRSRGKDALLSEADHIKLLSFAQQFNPAMAQLLIAMNDTGARPGSIYGVQASDLKEELNAWTGTETKRNRHRLPSVVYLTPRMVALHKELAARWPNGPIFRNGNGVPWITSAVDVWFWRSRQKLGLAPKACPVGYRHKFATEWLLAGGSMAYLAELQNTSVRMIEKHYGHLREHGTELRRRLVEFRQGQVESGGLAALPFPGGSGDNSGPGLSENVVLQAIGNYSSGAA